MKVSLLFQTQLPEKKPSNPSQLLHLSNHSFKKSGSQMGRVKGGVLLLFCSHLRRCCLLWGPTEQMEEGDHCYCLGRWPCHLLSSMKMMPQVQLLPWIGGGSSFTEKRDSVKESCTERGAWWRQSLMSFVLDVMSLKGQCNIKVEDPVGHWMYRLMMEMSAC